MWLPNVEVVVGNSSGSMNGDGSRKLLLHSTEGSTVEGAVAAYGANNSWPTLTVDCRRRRVVEHLALDVAARSLRNDPGGADQTNRDGSIHVQIELVGRAGDPATIGGPEDLDWLGRMVIRPICDLTGVPLWSGVTWAPYPASYGLGAPQRLSVANWDAYSGVLGHQHAPDNSHGDPGAIDIDRILAAARGHAPPEDDLPLNDDDIGRIRTAVRAELDAGTGAGQLGWAATSAATLSTAQGAINILHQVLAEVRADDGIDNAEVVQGVLEGLAPMVAGAVDPAAFAERLAPVLAPLLNSDVADAFLDALRARLAA